MSIIKEIKKYEKKLDKKTEKKSCIVCKKPAELCMRGLPENTYCKECAKEYFKLLSYLEKI